MKKHFLLVYEKDLRANFEHVLIISWSPNDHIEVNGYNVPSKNPSEFKYKNIQIIINLVIIPIIIRSRNLDYIFNEMQYKKHHSFIQE